MKYFFTLLFTLLIASTLSAKSHLSNEQSPATEQCLEQIYNDQTSLSPDVDLKFKQIINNAHNDKPWLLDFKELSSHDISLMRLYNANYDSDLLFYPFEKTFICDVNKDPFKLIFFQQLLTLIFLLLIVGLSIFGAFFYGVKDPTIQDIRILFFRAVLATVTFFALHFLLFQTFFGLEEKPFEMAKLLGVFFLISIVLLFFTISSNKNNSDS